MTKPANLAGAPPLYSTPARNRPRFFGTLLGLVTLLAGMLALSPLAPASAEPSGTCRDGSYTEVPLVNESNNFGLPLWLAVESYHAAGEEGFGICYGTGAPGQEKITGGRLYAYTWPPPESIRPVVGHESDESGAVEANATAFAYPHYSVTPGGAGGGQELAFWIPLYACAEALCYPGAAGHPNEVSYSVLAVGTISQRPAEPGSTSAAYRVSDLCLIVDGINVAGNCGTDLGYTGVTTGPSAGPDQIVGVGGQNAPCFLNTVCVPSFDYVRAGSELATIWVSGIEIPVIGVPLCVYERVDGYC
jgi:hypothetical protein